MTVKELREKLSDMPQDAEIVYYDGDNGATTVEEVEYQNEIMLNPWAATYETRPAHIVVLGW